MNATAQTVPATCPDCGRLSVDNERHCKPDDKPGHMAHWSKFCLTLRCLGCGTVYHNYGKTAGRAAQ